jgi:hypothetical protein
MLHCRAARGAHKAWSEKGSIGRSVDETNKEVTETHNFVPAFVHSYISPCPPHTDITYILKSTPIMTGVCRTHLAHHNSCTFVHPLTAVLLLTTAPPTTVRTTTSSSDTVSQTHPTHHTLHAHHTPAACSSGHLARCTTWCCRGRRRPCSRLTRQWHERPPSLKPCAGSEE